MQNFSGVIDHAETVSAGSLTTLKFQIVVLGPQLFLKREYPAKLFHSEISPYHILTLNKKVLNYKHQFRFQRVIDQTTLKPISDDFRSDYLGEYEAICETALARESGP
jgi:hypothetical protein